MQRALPSLMFSGPNVTHAHVSLSDAIQEDSLNPALLDVLTSHFARISPISLTFRPTPQLTPEGGTYLTPEPLEPLERLIASLPGLPVTPYPPHLTVEYSWGRDPAGGTHDIQTLLPITTKIGQADLNWYERHDSRNLASFAFGGACG
ncbi:2'-5' RNA ligase family protein [Amycolatopsis alba]|uniref:2'-5' RNA ligase family protein n=1 Tax=Amycolatopsis alba TaxID=76020 RepID=UPI0003A9992F|nr:2'-5' RNA ligase family protein [Amycolatopsis alba]